MSLLIERCHNQALISGTYRGNSVIKLKNIQISSNKGICPEILDVDMKLVWKSFCMY
jgi:hypothetical protein